jgi:hypothetical protein
MIPFLVKIGALAETVETVAEVPNVLETIVNTG